MPNFDKTGPVGQGSLTGLGLGSCKGNRKTAAPGGAGRLLSQAGKNKPSRGFGRNRGMRGGFGCRGMGMLMDSGLSLAEQEKFLENKLAIIRKLKEKNNQK